MLSSATNIDHQAWKMPRFLGEGERWDAALRRDRAVDRGAGVPADRERGRAEWIGAPKAVRAVAQACASNAIAAAIPCHRVVRTDGGLSGYRRGFPRKRALLDREAAA
jgi:O-6-methylguanine DNA methyltransferase